MPTDTSTIALNSGGPNHLIDKRAYKVAAEVAAGAIPTSFCRPAMSPS